MKKAILWGVPALILIGLVIWRFMGRSAADAAAGASSGSKKGAPTVTVSPAVSRTIVQKIESVGNVESPYKIETSPKSGGRIEYLQAREGDVVKAGEVLLKIDPSDLEGAVLQQQAAVAEARSRLAQAQMTQGSTNVGVTSQIQQQQAGLRSSQANLSQVRQNYGAQVAAAAAQVSAAQSAVTNAEAALGKENASLQNFQTKYVRTNNLYKQGFIAAQDLDDALTALNVQKGSVSVARGQVDAARSQLKVQQQNLMIAKRKGVADIAAARAVVEQGQATLRVANSNRSQTPAYQENLAALQSQVDAAIGQLKQAQSRLADTVVRSSITGTVTARKADPGGLATPGTPVLEVQLLDWLYVTASIPIESTALVHQGQTANITIDALPSQTFTGKISNINSAADLQSRQFGVKIRLDNLDHKLRPGMYARTKIITSKVDAPVVIPSEAIQTASDGTTATTVIDQNQVAHRRTITLGARDEKGSQVLSGVQSGENVVVLTLNALKDGQKVTISKPGDTSGGAKGKSGRSHRSQ